MNNSEVAEKLNEKIKICKNNFEGLMLSTHVVGMENLLNNLESKGFYKSPCSGGHHLSEEGGLLEHSLNVINIALKLAKTLDYENEKSVILAAGLHDIGKMGQFGKDGYLPNYLKSGQVSKTKPYVVNPNLMNVPHEIRSIQIASSYIELDEDENFAILYHNGLYGPLKYEITNKETPLYMIIHWADMWATRVIEEETSNE